MEFNFNALHPDFLEGTASESETTRGETPPAVRQFNQIHPIQKNRSQSDRLFVIFNTGDMDVGEAKTNLCNMLTSETYAAIVSVTSVRRPGSLPRLHVEVTAELGEAIKRLLRRKTTGRTPYMMRLLRQGNMLQRRLGGNAAINKWRMVAYRPYFDRPPPQTQINQPARLTNNGFMTLNVNGFHHKKTAIETCLRKERAMVASLQETLVADKHYPVVVKGYRAFNKPKQEGFRGHSLLVDDRLKAYELPHGDSNHLIHVKILGIRGTYGPAHIFSAYFPSGGNHRKDRTRLLKVLNERVKDILKTDSQAVIIGLGDFNIERDDMRVKLRKHVKDMSLQECTGSTWTRFPTARGSRCTSLDHVLVSQAASLLTTNQRVLRQYPISDHRPVVARIREVPYPLEKDEFRKSRTRINAGACRIYGKDIVSHNKWNVLADSLDEDPETTDLANLVPLFSEAFDAATRAHGIKVDISDPTHKSRLPRNIMSSLQTYRNLTKKVTAARAKGAVSGHLNSKRLKSKARYNKLLKAHTLEEKQRTYARISDSFVTHDHKSTWSRIRSVAGMESGGDFYEGHPVRNPNDGKLKTKPQDIVDAHTEHYRRILQHDPDNRAIDEQYWSQKQLASERAEEELEGLNGPLSWPECIESIRRMKRNTSAGSDGVHVNVLKQLVREECMAEISTRNPEWARPEYTMVDLPAEKLPSEPRTAMGKALYKILRAVWVQEKIPPQWQEVPLVSLAKPSGLSLEMGVDPESTDSYRGLTLISSAQKVLLGVVTERLALRYPLSEEQAGFRKKEEAIAQFLALAEIVRRRHLDSKPTYGVFVDFKKAYDRVQHGALFRILEHNGVRGKMLGFIKEYFRNNYVRVRVGGRLGYRFKVNRGNRQGCPLSPLLYVIFINDLLKQCSAGGVVVPGTKRDDPRQALPGYGGVDVCRGLMYADDVLALEDSPERVQVLLKNLDNWCKEWDAELGIKKCGVLLWSTDRVLRDAHNKAEYKLGDAAIPKVDKYKYLGLWVDERLIESRGNEESRTGTLEREHAKRKAADGTRVLMTLRPFLTDRNVPIVLKVHAVRNLIASKMLYGAEWIGYLNYNAEPLDRVQQQACRWILDVKGSDEERFDYFTVCYELGLPTMEEELHARRSRLVAKLQGEAQKTWLQRLWDEKPPSSMRKRTWVSGSGYWLSHTKKSLPKHSDVYTDEYLQFCRARDLNPDDVPGCLAAGWSDMESDPRSGVYPLRKWATLEQSFALTVRSNPYEAPAQAAMVRQRTTVDETGLDINFDPPDDQDYVVYHPTAFGTKEREEYMSMIRIPNGRKPEEVSQLRTVRDVVLERMMSKNKSDSFHTYDGRELGVTRGFLRSAVARPDLAEGFRLLTLARVGLFPTLRKLWRTAEHKGLTPTGKKGECPLCDEPVVAEFWTHLLLRCSDRWAAYWRDHCLNKPIALIRIGQDWGQTWINQSEDGIEIDECAHELAIGYALIGGWNHVKGDKIPTYSLGFGQLDVTPDEMDSYGAAYVAEFMQRVVPKYMRCFGVKVYSAGGKVVAHRSPTPPAHDMEEGSEIY